MRIVVGGLCAVVLAWVASLQTVAAGGSCADLAALALSNGKITRAETVDGGTPRVGSPEYSARQQYFPTSVRVTFPDPTVCGLVTSVSVSVWTRSPPVWQLAVEPTFGPQM